MWVTNKWVIGQDNIQSFVFAIAVFSATGLVWLYLLFKESNKQKVKVDEPLLPSQGQELGVPAVPLTEPAEAK